MTHWKTWKRKFASAGLAAVLLAGMFPLPAAAQGEGLSLWWAGTQGATSEEAEVTLRADLTENTGTAQVYIQLSEEQAEALEMSSLGEGLALVDSRPGEAQEPEAPEVSEEPETPQEPEVPGEEETLPPGTEGEENGESSQPPESSEAEEESSLPEGDSQEGEVSQTEETESQGPETTPGAAAPEQDQQETASSGLGVLAQPLKVFVGLFAGAGAGEGQKTISGKFLHFTVDGSGQASFEKTLRFTLHQGVDSLSLEVNQEDVHVY